MKMIGRVLSAAIILAAVALTGASAEEMPPECAPERLTGQGDDGRMQCDIMRALMILQRAERVHGDIPVTDLVVVDTTSPSGTAYAYALETYGNEIVLDARSVPPANGRGGAPACKLRSILPPPLKQELVERLDQINAGDLPGYGPREEVVINPDGSRSMRLVFDSHDVITRVPDGPGNRYFSRHAGSGDEVDRLNALIIGYANQSSNWTCDRR
jgi:hypothetical protein